jgi:hypothetical protein
MCDEKDSDDELNKEGQELAILVGSLKGKNRACVVKLVKDYDEWRVELDEINEHACQLDDALTEEKNNVDELEAKLLKETQKASKLIEMTVALKTKNKKLKVAHEKLKKEVELMDVGSKAIKCELVSITSSHEELKASHAKIINMPSTSNASNPIDVDAYIATTNLVEATPRKENVELKAQLERGLVTCIQGEKNLNDLMSNQKANINKQGLGNMPKPNANGKAWLPHQICKKTMEQQKKMTMEEDTLGIVDQGIRGGKANRSYDTYDNSKGTFNPSYVLCKHNDGSVYAKYVGAHNIRHYHTIWVPKTLVANNKGPIVQWVPKVKV